ncbi:hypothetical protein BASA62_001258 [Batrachochytrium salamandrivorans]|nr:hypothetical protein BASA62_001258 [Batrachochytrium salamandrivorans]
MQDPPSVLLSLAQIKILVVPVHPIRQDTFQTYLHLLSQFTSVSLQDLTPPDAITAKFTSQFYHDGLIHFNFETSHNKEHTPIEDIQLGRQVLGVIGIMHCQQTLNLAEGCRRFQQIAQRYPTALAFRCFGFEPLDTQTDDIKGLIMIPNVGDVPFYLQTMINDFTADLLLALGSLAGQIERRSIINGPVMISPLFQSNPSASRPSVVGSQLTADSTYLASPMSASSSFSGQSPSTASTHAPSSAHFSQGANLFDRLRDNSATNILSQDMSVSSSATSSNAQTGQFGIAQTSSSSGSTITSSGSAPTVTVFPATQQQQPSLSAMGSTSLNLGFGLGLLLNPDKSRKRTPARIQKLLGDLYLMAGRLDMAIASFFAAIESTKHSNDLQWQASAMESLCCAQLLSLAIQSGACNGTRHIVFSNPCTPATHADQAVNPTDSSSGDPKSSEEPLASSTETPQTRYSDAYHESTTVVTGGLPTTDALLAVAKEFQPLASFFADLPDRFREIVQLYDRSCVFGVPGFYPIFQISACLKLASFLSQVCLRGDMILFGVNGAGVSYWNSEMRGLGAEIAARIGSSGSGGSNTGGLAHVGVGGIATASSMAASVGGIIGGVGQGGVLGGMIPGLASTPAGPGPMTIASAVAVSNSLSVSPGQPFGLISMVNSDRIQLQNGLGASKVDVISWLMRAWHSGIEYLTYNDQIACVSAMSAVCGSIGSHRKHAFFLHQIALLSNVAISGKYMSGNYGNDGVNNLALSETSMYAGTRNLYPPLECLERVCGLIAIDAFAFLGSSQNKTSSAATSTQLSEDHDIWLEEYQSQDDLNHSVVGYRSAISRGIIAPSIRHGWPSLQIGVLKECMSISKFLGDHASVVRYISIIFRQLYRHTSRRDQIHFSELLHQAALHHRQACTHECDDVHNADSPSFPPGDSPLRPLINRFQDCAFGAPVLRRLVPIRQPNRQVPSMRLRKDLFPDESETTTSTTQAPKNVYIYNPYANKATSGGDIVLVVNETVQVDVILANPFVFDLDIQQIALCTSGVAFDAVTISTRILAEARVHSIRLTGTPLEAGTLNIHGVTMRMLGGCIEDRIYPVHRSLDDPKLCTKDGKKPNQEDRHRAGKKTLEFLDGPSASMTARASNAKSAIPEKMWSIPMKVIAPQPMLKVFSTSLGGHQARMLFEGERSTFKTTVQNIGLVPITYIQIKISERVDGSKPDNGRPQSLSGFLDTYEQDIHTKSLRACWFEKHRVLKRECDVDVSDSIKDSKAVAAYRNTDRALKPLQSIFGVFGHVTLDAKGFMHRLDVDLQPGEYLELVFGVYGKRNCTGADLQFEYACVDAPHSAVSDSPPSDPHFYTRLLIMPVLLTIQPVLTVHNVDFLLHSQDELAAAQVVVGSPGTEDWNANSSQDIDNSTMLAFGDMAPEICQVDAVMDAVTDNDQVRLSFVLTFDVHNSWNEPFYLKFDLYEDDETDIPTSSYNATIHSGAAKRIILPLKRIRLPASVIEQSIPTPSWKQYILNKTALQSPEGEALSRAIYWYREYLVGGLSHRGRIIIHWNCSKSRQGLLALRNFSLTRRMLHIVKSESISLVPTVLIEPEPAAEDTSCTDLRLICGAHGLVRLRADAFQCRIKTLAKLQWQVTNYKSSPVYLFIRIVPMLLEDTLYAANSKSGSGHVSVSDLKDKLFLTGQLECSLARLDPGCSTTHSVSIWMRSLVCIRFVCHVEEVIRPVRLLELSSATKDNTTVPKKTSKYDVPPVLLGNIEKIHRDYDGIIIEGVLDSNA